MQLQVLRPQTWDLSKNMSHWCWNFDSFPQILWHTRMTNDGQYFDSGHVTIIPEHLEMDWFTEMMMMLENINPALPTLSTLMIYCWAAPEHWDMWRHYFRRHNILSMIMFILSQVTVLTSLRLRVATLIVDRLLRRL